MPTVASIQSGSKTIVAADGTSVTQAISAVTLANSVVYYSSRSGDTAGRLLRHIFRVSLTSTTQITFVRNASASATDVILSWVVVEFDSGEIQSIQTGSVDCDSATKDVTISAVVLAATIPFVFITTDELTAGVTVNATATFTSTTNLRFTFSTLPVAGDYFASWQVVEFIASDVAVQSGTIVLAGDVPGPADGTKTATISAVVLAKTLVAHGGLLTLNTSVPPNRSRASLHLASTTTVEAGRDLTGTTLEMTVAFHVLEFEDHVVVQSGTNTIADTSTSENPTFTQLGANSVAFMNHWMQNAKFASDTGNYDDKMATLVLSSPPDDLVITRVGSDQSMIIPWFVWDFTAAAGPPQAPHLILQAANRAAIY